MELLPIEYNECWIWRGTLTHNGYGVYRSNGRTRVAHRHVYTLLVDDIPKELELDHLCKNILCVNPAHLEPVTRLENMRRRYVNYRCKRGHKIEGDNAQTYVYKGYTQRKCRTCYKLWQREHYKKKVEQVPN